jgi:hypothetical protein
MEMFDFFKLKRYQVIFVITFVAYFIFFQIATRLFLITNIKFPTGVSLVISTSPPVSPQDMPFPLWGPYLSITTPHFTWAMTPLSLGISFILSFLVALNITLYLMYYSMLRLRASNQLLASLGILATSLSCSCELFTGLIGSVASNIPFLISVTFMERLFEGLVSLAIALLSLSTYVLYSELSGKKVLKSIGRGLKSYLVFVVILIIDILLPFSPAFSFVKLIFSEIAGGILALLINKKWRYGVVLSIFINVIIISVFNIIYDNPLIYLIPFMGGFIGAMGYPLMKPWARLGLLHVIAWSLIMPGPISIILGYPIPFFNFSPSQLIELWITTWIIGTPIAWYAGVYYLQYLRENMATKPLNIRIIPKLERDYGIKWILIGSFAILIQILYFMTHVPYYVDYNGYDLIFLFTMTVMSTFLIVLGSVLLGYGLSKLIKTLFDIPKPKKWFKFSVIFGAIYALLSGIIHIGVSGYPYPPVLFGLFGIPMLAPSVTIYIPHVIGIYINPLEALQLIASSMLAGGIASYTFENKLNKRNLIASIIGSVAVCPACTITTFSTYTMGLLVSALASSYLANFMSTLQGELLTSFTSEIFLLGLMIYTGNKVKIKLAPKGSSLRLY